MNKVHTINLLMGTIITRIYVWQFYLSFSFLSTCRLTYSHSNLLYLQVLGLLYTCWKRKERTILDIHQILGNLIIFNKCALMKFPMNGSCTANNLKKKRNGYQFKTPYKV